MTSLYRQHFRTLFLAFVTGLLVLFAQIATAAEYAAHVMDARTGETLYSKNADKALPPASLTKMMTLYIAFQDIEAGRVSLDTLITVSKNAADQAPTRLGLKAGQKIALRYLIRAAAVKSANDAATAIGDALGGSPEKFAERMTATARRLGMKNSTFKNANGLSMKGHRSSAQDMSILGRHLFYDFPQYYNIFSRRSTDAGIATVANTNRKFLDAYEGADGIKTGYTSAAGFNLTASAERNGVRIIATIFGGSSTAQRNDKMAELLDIGFSRADPGAPTIKPNRIAPEAGGALVASAEGVDEALPEVQDGAGKTLRLNLAVATSLRPQPRPGASADAIEAAITEVASLSAPAADPPAADSLAGQALALASGSDPSSPSQGLVTVTAKADTQNLQLASGVIRPAKRSTPIYTDNDAELAAVPAKPVVVTRVSTSGGQHWGIHLGKFNTRTAAEKLLLKVQLAESATLGEGLRKVIERSGGFDANFMGLTQENADLACRRLQSRGIQCFTIGE